MVFAKKQILITSLMTIGEYDGKNKLPVRCEYTFRPIPQTVVIALMFVGGMFIYNLSGRMQHVADDYDSDTVIKMINDMEAPAAGGNE